jgi:hypothetical protein
MDLAAIVERLINQFLAEPKNAEAASLVRQVRALPLHSDGGGFYGLRSTGELIEVRWDEPESVQPLTDARSRNLALHQGAGRYPELSDLEPVRNSEAIVCASCYGSGLARVPPYLQQQVVCWCGGLGWLPSPADEVKASQPIEAIRQWWQFWRRR